MGASEADRRADEEKHLSGEIRSTLGLPDPAVEGSYRPICVSPVLLEKAEARVLATTRRRQVHVSRITFYVSRKHTFSWMHFPLLPAKLPVFEQTGVVYC